MSAFSRVILAVALLAMRTWLYRVLVQPYDGNKHVHAVGTLRQLY